MDSDKHTSSTLSLDFDEWMNLAKNNPDEFEIKRRKHIESFFNNVPEDKQHRLKRLQWRIDQTRKLSRTPMASCIAISNMMWDSVNRLKDHQYELVNLATGQSDKLIKKNTASATILRMNP